MDNDFIRFGTKLYRQIVDIPIKSNCAPLVADLFLFCYERDFMKSLSQANQADIIEAFNFTSRYLDDLLNINNLDFDFVIINFPFLDGDVPQRTSYGVYPTHLNLWYSYP